MVLSKVVYSNLKFINLVGWSVSRLVGWSKNKMPLLSVIVFGCFISNSIYAQGVSVENYFKNKSTLTKKYTVPVAAPNVAGTFSFQNTSNVFIKPFDKKDLPFFCRIEYDMFIQKSIPVKIRLGDVQYVDELEGKKH